ncbi:hypothetical protein Ddc_18555 [Ditylenchus destructor]|nr:hypothetical protein Ddc_18555 [Ditylenchus destructor]
MVYFRNIFIIYSGSRIRRLIRPIGGIGGAGFSGEAAKDLANYPELAGSAETDPIWWDDNDPECYQPVLDRINELGIPYGPERDELVAKTVRDLKQVRWEALEYISEIRRLKRLQDRGLEGLGPTYSQVKPVPKPATRDPVLQIEEIGPYREGSRSHCENRISERVSNTSEVISELGTTRAETSEGFVPSEPKCFSFFEWLFSDAIYHLDG